MKRWALSAHLFCFGVFVNNNYKLNNSNHNP